MNRRIKFRGQRFDTKEWVYTGLLYRDNGFSQFAFHFQVIPETVGQSTGLLDKNGKEIYEGDKVKHNAIYEQGKELIIVFKDGAFCLYSPTSTRGNQYVTIRDAMFQAKRANMTLELEVVGNIHDK